MLLNHLFFMISFQDFSILCWNIRGAINPAGRRHTRELIKKHNPSMVIIMETHCAFKKAERFWQKLGYEASACSEAQGHSGGIWILVEQKRNYTVSLVECFHQMVTISIKRGAHVWWFSAVYASPTPSTREHLWDHICSLRADVHGPWLLMGDYNEILHPSEVKGVPFLQRRAQKMASVMEHCGLLDIGSIGIFFTWVRRAIGQPTISKRLDRALVDCSWRHFLRPMWRTCSCINQTIAPCCFDVMVMCLASKAAHFAFKQLGLHILGFRV